MDERHAAPGRYIPGRKVFMLSGEFNKPAYDMQYNREHITRKFIPFNDKNPDDVEMLKWLETVGNVTQYIKRLIREDMNRN